MCFMMYDIIVFENLGFFLAVYTSFRKRAFLVPENAFYVWTEG